MKQISGSISTTYVCDACETESVSAPLPSNWKKVTVISSDRLLSIRKVKYFGPVCLASSDPAVLQDIKDSLLD